MLNDVFLTFYITCLFVINYSKSGICYSLKSLREQRDREVFEDFSAGYWGQIESLVFANSFMSGTFTAQKKPVE